MDLQKFSLFKEKMAQLEIYPVIKLTDFNEIDFFNKHVQMF